MAMNPKTSDNKMLRKTIILFVFAVVAIGAAAASPPFKPFGTKPGKLALIVAIGKYPMDSGWSQLSSHNDVRILRDALLKQGFAEGDIAIVQDEAATRQGILSAIRTSLIEKAKPGDVAVFHFSGHGQQAADDNGDEVDGFDEALVPFDSPKHYQSGIYEGQNLIRDEELGGTLKELRSKLGPEGHLLTLIDACHSGTATRGLAKARGTDERMASPDYFAAKVDRFGDENSLDANVAGDLAPMVALFSASPNQLSYEHVDAGGEGYGILSYTFSKVFGSANEGTSYRDLFDQIRLQVSALSPRQTPQAEGQLDEAVLGGQIAGNRRYFLPSNWIDGQTVKLDVGTLAGLHDGSLVAFYPPSVQDTAGVLPFAFGKIANASLLDCDVELEKTIAKQERNCRIYIRERNYGSLSASLRLEVASVGLSAALRQIPTDCPAIRFTENNPELVLQELPGEDKLLLLTKDDFVLGSFKIPENENYRGLLRQVQQQVVAFAQAKFLRPMEVQDSRLGLSLDFLTPDGQPVPSNRFKLGEELRIRIRNTGLEPCYFSVLDIQPDNQLNVIVPAGKPAVDYYLPPGGQYDYPELVVVSEPVGTEVLKLIASEQPLDLTNIVQTRGVQDLGKPQGGKHPFEVLLRQTYLLESTRGETGNLPGGGLAVGSVVVEIRE
jgi:metacaspase-1